jgi:uncharacterized membrane protein
VLRLEGEVVGEHYVYWRFLFWPQLAGMTFLVAGLIAVRRQLSWRLDDLTVLGRVFVPAALATFGAEHLASAHFIMQGVPAWMPWHLFWAYFVGCALFAASVSFVANRYVKLSSWLLGLMLLIFVLTMHLPNVVHAPHDRIRWAVMLRDFLFGLGAWSLALTRMDDPRARRVFPAIRWLAAFILLFFAAEHFLHPVNAPGVPLEQETPAFIPLRPLWGYLIGTITAAAGISILLNKFARTVTTWLAIADTAVVLFIYVPLFVVASVGSQMNTAVNYIFDTLLLAGAVFLLAGGMPSRDAVGQREQLSIGDIVAEDAVLRNGTVD